MGSLTTISASDSSFGLQPSSFPVLLPVSPRVEIAIRAGVLSDLPFLDSLQKLHTKQVGWMPTKQFEGKIAAGHVLIAEEIEPQRHGDTEARSSVESASVSPCLRGKSVGYVIGNDQYFKRDDVGIIYQLNVMPGKQRGLIGASLLKAQFERSAYGCKLYCCWCAQDIAANKFWEAMGFAPLAFRAGSEKKSRVHIFWQKRIRAGDTTTPWWFPSQTSGGSIREDRIVLPIPPGTHWSDAKPLVLPGGNQDDGGRLKDERKQKKLASSSSFRPPPSSLPAKPALLWFGSPKPAEKPREKAPKPKRVKQKNDPRLVSAARELRDRWLERVNADSSALPANGKYDVSKALAAPAVDVVATVPLLEAA